LAAANTSDMIRGTYFAVSNGSAPSVVASVSKSVVLKRRIERNSAP
jgi:hypothetical protein